MTKRTKFDPWIVGPIIVLILFSLTILRSVLPSEAGRYLVIAFSGFVVFFLVSQIDYRTFRAFSKQLYVLSLLMLLATFILGETTRGSVRWIRIGSLTLQTSEMIKPLIILSLAALGRKLNFKKYLQLFFYLFLVIVPVFLISQQPDLGSAMVLLVIGIAICFAAGITFRAIAASVLVIVLLSPMLFGVLKPYQQERIHTFFDPFSDPLGSGYSVIQSTIAVGSGQLFGRGLGHGTQSQLRFLPERHSDFIFASLAEELGFIGALLVLVTYAALLYHILTIAREAPDAYGSLITLGVFSMILFQITVNIGMNMGILPISGITLPLVSSGGSSMLTIMVSLGLVHSVSIRKKPPKTIEIH